MRFSFTYSYSSIFGILAISFFTLISVQCTQASEMSEEAGTESLKYSNPTIAVSLEYPAGWNLQESPDHLVVNFEPIVSTDKQVSFQVKAMKLHSGNFSLTKYLRTYIDQIQQSPQVNAINDSQPTSILGLNGYQILYDRSIGNNEYSILQILANNKNFLYVFSFTVPKNQSSSSSPIIEKIIQSAKPYSTRPIDEKIGSGFKVYENTEHGVSIQYPNNWIKKNEYSNSIVRFIVPDTGGELTKPTGILISIFQRPEDHNLDEFIKYFHSTKYTEQSGFTEVNSSDTRLAGLGAREITMYEETDNVLDPKSDLKVMRVYAFDSTSHKGYTIRYYSEPGLFNKYLPIAHKMINSFEIK
jgi:PsbP-like protein